MGYTFQRLVQLAASVCLFVCVFQSIVEEKYEWCQFAGYFFFSPSSSYITTKTTTTTTTITSTTATTTITTTTTTPPAVATITIMAHGSAIGSGIAIQARRIWVQIPMVYTEFFHSFNPSGCSVGPGV